MALLERFRALGGARAAALLLAGGALTGCVILDAWQGKDARFAFSHKLHVVDQGLECSGCHVQAPGAVLPSLPGPRTCALCHDEIDAEKPAERQVASLFVDKQYRGSHSGALGDEVLFPHDRHAAEGVLECAQCHVGIEDCDDVLDLKVTRMADCQSCHAERKVAAECSTCHSLLREDVAPPSHDKLWTRSHGRVVCERGERTADNCSLCHTDSTCASCHLENAPENHTDYWRKRAHGITAALDRQSCATCHREDSCTACHSESRPLSHTGSWGGTTSRHCVSCHFPVQNETCSVCHQGTPSHALATPKPPDHSDGMNCRMCHGVGQPLPHVDNGDSCSLCHK